MGFKVKKLKKSVKKTVKNPVKKLSKNFKDTWRDAEKWLDVFDGDMEDEAEKLEKRQKALEGRQKNLDTQYNDLQSYADGLSERLDRFIAFHEIFSMAESNRTEAYVAAKSTDLEGLYSQLSSDADKLNADVTAFNKKYKNQMDLLNTDGWLTKIYLSIILIQGRFWFDVKDVLTGDTDGKTWKNIGRAVGAAIAIALAVLLVIATKGTGIYHALAIIALVTTSILSFMTLDAIYGYGLATGALFDMLDLLFNDILNSDDWMTDKMNRLDPDHEEHGKMVMVVQLILIVTTVLSSWGASYGVPTTGSTPASAPKSYLGGAVKIGDTLSKSSLLGMSFQSIYEVYQIAMSVYDYQQAKEAHDAIKEKLEDLKSELEEELTAQTEKRINGHFKDSAYFLQDQQEYIDRYIWSMVSANMYVDPYGTTPVANIRFSPDKDTRTTSFGFEDIFDENQLAGSKGYFDSIIYGG